ncbi:MAG: radical SAM protein [Spirochaetales bacterium]|nr:radical SAM protein [Spirochaetales bacterium]
MLTIDTIKRKGLLYKSGVEYADYCLNHVEGCSHGCRYPCYAFLMKKRCGKIKTYEEWCHPKIISNAMELLEKEIPKFKKNIDYVHLCFSTDPFMYNQSEISELSLRIIRELNRHDIPVTTLTKGITPKELIQCTQYSNAINMYGITLVSLDEDFRKKYEPNAALFLERINALKVLHDNRCKTYVSIEPYPTPNLIKQDLKEILEATGFVDKIIFGRMNYSRKVTEFKGYKDFYNELAYYVIAHCKKKNIEWHIKERTITEKLKYKW